MRIRLLATTPFVSMAVWLGAAGAAGPLAAQPLDPATISIDASAVHPAPGYSADTFVEAVSERLASRRFTVLEGHGHARLVAELALTQIETGAASARIPPPARPRFAGRGVAGVGGNLTVPLPADKSMIVPILQSRLELRIKRLGEHEVLWKAAALTVRASNAGNGREQIVATDLARALFASYPDQPQGIVTVP